MKTILVLISMLISFNLFASYIQTDLDFYMDDVDGWCSDTFCGGDFNYHSPKLSYNPETSLFRIIYKVEDYYSGEFILPLINRSLPAEITHESDWTKVTVANKNRTVIESFNYEPSFWKEKGNQPVATFSCYFQLQPEFANKLDQDMLYEITLDCVNGFEELL